MNITDFEKAPVHVVFAEVERLASAQGVSVKESELIGLMPRQAIEMAVADILKLSGFKAQHVLENRIDTLSAR